MSGSEAPYQRDQEEYQKYKKQYFRDSRGRHCNTAESKDGSHDGDNQEDDSPVKHIPSMERLVELIE